MSDSNNISSNEAKKAYQKPQLAIYGNVSDLTQATALMQNNEDTPGQMHVKSVP